MKKLSGLLAVSLVAVMMAPAARADIASTEYVNKNMEAKANKVTDTNNYTGDADSPDKYPSMAVANQMAKSAAAKSAAGKLSNTFENKKNQVMVTNATGAVTPTTVDTEGTGNAVTAVTVADGKYTVTKGTTFATKEQLDTTNTNVTNLTTRVTTAEGTINTQGTEIAELKTGKQDNLTAGTGIKIDKTTNTISTDGLATNDDLTTLQTTVAGHTTSIDKLDGAATVTGSVKQQISAAKSELTTSIEANKTAAANAKSAADAAQATANKAVVANTAITGGTKTKITYDAKGLVTAGADLTAADIPAGLIKNGTNVTVSRDATTGVVTISSADTKYTLPTATDTVLGGVKVDTAMSDTSTNPVQNKVANAAIADAKKAGTDAATAAAKAKSAADAAQATANKAVVANTAITGSTKTKITYDAKGLVTGGSDLTADDIPALTTGKITGLDTALAAKFVAPGTSVTSKDGTYTLTMKVVNNQPTYAWEEIGR